MELTPLKVSGKRKKKDTPGNVAKKRLGGRQHPAPDAESRKKSKKLSLKNLKPRNKMSTLEKLPTELVESIFLHSMNINLPLASPTICGKLSSESTYIKSLMSAFGPCWAKADFNASKEDEEFDTSNIYSDEYLTGVQNALLRRRWVNLPLILKAKQKWYAKYSQEGEVSCICFADPSDYPFMFGISPTSRTAQEAFDHEFTLFSNYVTQPERFDPLVLLFRNEGDLAKGVEIPDDLLLGPWTEEQKAMLFWLVRGGARVNNLTSTSFETAAIGLRSAIERGDVLAICLLTATNTRELVDNNLILWAVDNVGGDKKKVMQCLVVLAEGFIRSWDDRYPSISDDLEIIWRRVLREEDHETFDLLLIIYNSWGTADDYLDELPKMLV